MGSSNGGSDDDSKGVQKSTSLWFAPSPSKRWTEIFFLAYSPVWITWALGIIVPFKLFEIFTEVEYMLVGIVAAAPLVLVPLIIVGKADKVRPLANRYWVKANLWIAIFSFIGNYFWTHYFYTLLGASYTFPSWRLNNVPIPLYLLTHAYFCFYHTLSNITLRRLRHALGGISSPFIRVLIQAVWVVALSYFTAFMETATISNFQYYSFVDAGAMYRVGSLFYAIYFFVSFPMFFRMEEKVNEQAWSLWRVAVDALGAGMLVTILLDMWRLAIGPIVEIPGLPTYKECLTYGLPWLK
eukprot:TRINITY_DN6499_c0_g1_i1.p1 TRINITY_DN6499_c0_g1~~TRINITY_DN6499_c0_g1_i1.p1  ORF type:complete len:297 (-),score=31.71 TRINITY_DN6499_c0_g1_i1:214-1104(-)